MRLVWLVLLLLVVLLEAGLCDGVGRVKFRFKKRGG